MAFVGRQQEGRALLLSVRAGRGVVLAAPPGYGKSALLEEVRPALETWSAAVWCDKIAPFGAFLKDLFRGLWDARIAVEGVPLSRDLEAKLGKLLLDYTSERARLMEQAREARLESARLERCKGREAERQLVRSPVAGQVAEVRVRDVGPKGVTVEVVVVSEPATR
jgi:hypothetical protein